MSEKAVLNVSLFGCMTIVVGVVFLIQNILSGYTKLNSGWDLAIITKKKEINNYSTFASARNFDVLRKKKEQLRSLQEQFSLQCRKVIGFALITQRDWLKKTRAKTSCTAHVLPRLSSATCNYVGFLLVDCIVFDLCDWLEWLLWFWFYDNQLRPAPIRSGMLRI